MHQQPDAAADQPDSRWLQPGRHHVRALHGRPVPSELQDDTVPEEADHRRRCHLGGLYSHHMQQPGPPSAK